MRRWVSSVLMRFPRYWTDLGSSSCCKILLLLHQKHIVHFDHFLDLVLYLDLHHYLSFLFCRHHHLVLQRCYFHKGLGFSLILFIFKAIVIFFLVCSQAFNFLSIFSSSVISFSFSLFTLCHLR